jgi:hemerythrin
MSVTEGIRDGAAPRPASDNSILWSDARLLGYGPMDSSHEEFYALAFRLLTCTDDSAPAALAAFEEHAIAHFGQEEEWMRTTAFPPTECHVEEHDAVLRSLREVIVAVSAGHANAELARGFAAYLFQWFPGHADYLDAALAAWMSKRAYGGQPIVLRRSR